MLSDLIYFTYNTDHFFLLFLEKSVEQPVATCWSRDLLETPIASYKMYQLIYSTLNNLLALSPQIWVQGNYDPPRSSTDKYIKYANQIFHKKHKFNVYGQIAAIVPLLANLHCHSQLG